MSQDGLLSGQVRIELVSCLENLVKVCNALYCTLHGRIKAMSRSVLFIQYLLAA